MELGLILGAGGYKDDAPDGASDTGSLVQCGYRHGAPTELWKAGSWPRYTLREH